jgi:hypothetical protein
VEVYFKIFPVLASITFANTTAIVTTVVTIAGPPSSLLERSDLVLLFQFDELNQFIIRSTGK